MIPALLRIYKVYNASTYLRIASQVNLSVICRCIRLGFLVAVWCVYVGHFVRIFGNGRVATISRRQVSGRCLQLQCDKTV